MRNGMKVLNIVAIALFLCWGAVADDGAATQGDPYTANVCPVSGEILGTMGDPVTINVEGREIRLCCAGCEKTVRAKPAKYLAKIDAEMIANQTPFYPLDTCMISGKPLGDDIIDVIHNNRLVRFCCEGCPDQFAAAPAKFLAKLDRAAIAKQKDAYPVAACVVSGEKLSAHTSTLVDKVVGNRLVRLCCATCETQLSADPVKYLAMLSAGKVTSSGEGQDHNEGSDSK